VHGIYIGLCVCAGCHALYPLSSADDESTLCAEALPFVPQSLVVTAGTGRRRRQRQQQQRKASAWWKLCSYKVRAFSLRLPSE
jgi:hypothetical protein